VALPKQVLEDAVGVTAPELKDNFNRLVIVALQEYIRRRREYAFEQSMAEMAADPAIKYENAAIADEFKEAESDGLKDA
jgi:hypothetical protein